jgi:hypothetical protein
MNNALKIVLLAVVASGLGYLTFSMVNKNNQDISSRPANGETVPANPASPQDANFVQPQEPGTKSASLAKTKWVFEKTEHNFGTVKQGDDVEYKFKFTNTGSEPLVIEDAKGSCGCTVPSYPKEPLAPGTSGEILVKFNSAGKSGNQQKTVTLTANTEPISTILTIKAEVDAPAGEKKK